MRTKKKKTMVDTYWSRSDSDPSRYATFLCDGGDVSKVDEECGESDREEDERGGKGGDGVGD